jgi:uncharacterized membrane protein HdeD (DUF308 family)
MSKFFLIIIGIFLAVHGVLSIYTAFKGGPLRGVMSPSDTFLVRKIFGEKASDSFFNFFWGIAELIFGILILMGKFN